MSLAKNFQKQHHAQVKIHAAWLPVANTFEIGTYGIVEGGVLRPLGHITGDFGVEVGEIKPGGSSKFAFSSAGVTTIKTVAGAQVDSFPDVGELEAKLTFSFKDKDSVVLKAPEITHDSMVSIRTVAKKLAAQDDWRRTFRVVSGTYRADDSIILLASEAETKIAFNAKVSALKAIQGGSGTVDFELSSSSERSLHFIGKSGVIGLALFKLNWLNRVDVLAEAEELDVETDWEELSDDI